MTLGDLLAGKIVARVFDELGSDHTPCQRLEFKGGTYPDNEIAQGGMDRHCFERVIRQTIEMALKDLKP